MSWPRSVKQRPLRPFRLREWCVLGEIEKTKIIFAQGPVHLDEGYSAREVTSIVRVLAEAGIKQLIVTRSFRE